MKWYRKLHWQIIIGLIGGLIYGMIATQSGWGEWTENWISPFGVVFIRLLKFIAVPLVLTSLITGVTSLSDFKKLSRIGGKTIGIYIGTTAIAVTLGLIVVNILKPGDSLPDSMKTKLQDSYQSKVSEKEAAAETTKKRGPLQPMVDMVPDNFFSSASDNREMLKIVFISIMIGIALLKVAPKEAEPVIQLIQGLNSTVIHLVHLIMLGAPLGVFALMANTITSLAGDNPGQIMELIRALGFYCFTVILALSIQAAVVYPAILHFFTPMPLKRFFSGIAPAQLVAFSTSSSGATMPVTMEQCEKKLGVSEEITSFVIPLGATINMDGTALYQAVAAVFIAQVSGIELTMGNQITIILTAVLASIGTAAVPGAGIIMLVIILQSINVPAEGIALILGVDRILDMIRTTVNITGDAAVATLVASGENQLDLSKTVPTKTGL